MKLDRLFMFDKADVALDLCNEGLSDLDAVDIGAERFEIPRRSDVSSRTRTRSSREARVPLPWVLPSAEPWEVETEV
jgi:hypothetical protein